MLGLTNPLDTFFVNLFFPLYSNPIVQLFVTIVVNLIYFYGFYEFYFFARNKDKKRVLQLLLTTAVGLLLVFSLKYYVERPRPYQAFDFSVLETKSDPSFPSAHTFLALLFYYFATKIQKLKRFRFIFAMHLLVLVPVGVMITGVHYLTDVLASAVIGFIIPRIFSERVIAKIFKKFS